MSKHDKFILTPITSVLNEAVVASYGVGTGIESYSISDYIMQSLFLKMTGFQEQKMKCISWEMATNDFNYRRKLLSNEDKLGEHSTYTAKCAIYKRLNSVIRELDENYSISDKFNKDEILEDSINQVKSIFTNSNLAVWHQKTFDYFSNDIITSSDQFMVDDRNLFKGIQKDKKLPTPPDSSKYKLDNPNSKKAYDDKLKEYKEKKTKYEDDIRFNLQAKYQNLYNQRNKLAHNVISYQDNLPTLKTLQAEDEESRNYFVWFAILVLIDNIFMQMYKIYLAALEKEVY